MSGDYLYWLGAGASFYSLPLVSSFTVRLEGFREMIRIQDFREELDDDKIEDDAEGKKKDIIQTIDWLVRNLKEQASVDTFAKKLYFKNDHKELQRLKAVLSCFFVGEQSLKPVDYRYDSFFASILRRKDHYSDVVIPDDIKFLLWNYDLQLEKAYYGYTQNADKVRDDLTFSGKLYHLNGYCGTKQPGHIGKEFTEAYETKDKLSKVVLNLFSEYVNYGASPDINFAWEMNENLFNHNIGQITDNVSTLIIIGYSFPFFNREIDKKIFSRLGKLKDVFVQTPKETFVGIQERIKAINPDIPELKLIEDTSQFYIPFNYNL